MTTHTLTCDVHVAWWLMPYLHVLGFICELMQCEPDLAKLERVIARGVRVQVR